MNPEPKRVPFMSTVIAGGSKSKLLPPRSTPRNRRTNRPAWSVRTSTWCCCRIDSLLGQAVYETQAQTGRFLVIELPEGSSVIWLTVDQNPVLPLKSEQWLLACSPDGARRRPRQPFLERASFQYAGDACSHGHARCPRPVWADVPRSWRCTFLRT